MHLKWRWSVVVFGLVVGFNRFDSTASGFTMQFSTLLAASLAAVASAKPIPTPLDVIAAAGPPAGQVITKCSAPGYLALAFDDGPYQYTQKLIDTLDAGGAKGTFFVTGTLYGRHINYQTQKATQLTISHRLHLRPTRRRPQRLQRRSPNRIPQLVAPAKLRLHVHQRPNPTNDASRNRPRQHHRQKTNLHAPTLPCNRRQRAVYHEDTRVPRHH